MQRTLTRALVLVALGAGLGLAINAARGERGIVLSQGVRSIAEGGACSAPSDGADHRLISLEEAAALRGQSGAAFGDTRPPDDYARGHVAGAWHVPCFASAQASASPLAHLGTARTLVLYGADEAQADAHLAAEELTRRGGFPDVRILHGGFRAWQAAGLPAESGPCDQCRRP
jgi:rhodanese-related sulfurtransferase